MRTWWRILLGLCFASILAQAAEPSLRSDTHELRFVTYNVLADEDPSGQRVPKLLEILRNTDADIIVLASPNYIFSVSAQMKALFDRCCGPIHTQALEGKYGAAVVSSGGPGNEEVEKYMLRFANSLGAWAVGSTGTDLAHIFNPEKLPQVLKAAADLGTELVEAIGSGKTYPEQEPALQGFREYMRSWLVTQGERWPFEAQYWKDRS